MHQEISSLQIKVRRENDVPASDKWAYLYDIIKNVNGYGGAK